MLFVLGILKRGDLKQFYATPGFLTRAMKTGGMCLPQSIIDAWKVWQKLSSCVLFPRNAITGMLYGSPNSMWVPIRSQRRYPQALSLAFATSRVSSTKPNPC